MRHSDRTFEDKPAVRTRVPLLVGITGPSSSGKTYSALRLASGIQRVTGGSIFFIDTEAKRALHYADSFKFQHIDFQPPFGPLDYLAAIEHCVTKGAKVIVIDSMTHEHSGVGGVMDQVDAALDGKIARIFKGEKVEEWKEEKERKKSFMLAMVKPKSERKRLNARIVQLGINAIFCYRALDKVKPVTGGEPEKLGWQPETTSPLFYEMTARFLLPPGSDGHPVVNPANEFEKLSVKNPEQFRAWFTPGMRLDETLGQKLAEWAAGARAGLHEDSRASAIHPLVTRYEACRDRDTQAALKAEREAAWSTMTTAQREAVKAAAKASDAKIERLENGEVDEQHEPAA